jgi:hypothetical protein
MGVAIESDDVAVDLSIALGAGVEFMESVFWLFFFAEVEFESFPFRGRFGGGRIGPESL